MGYTTFFYLQRKFAGRMPLLLRWSTRRFKLFPLMSSFSTVRSTTASGSAVYESERAMHEYIQFHYGKTEDLFPYQEGPLEALSFVPNLVKWAMEATKSSTSTSKRALDVGCAVGGLSFQLTQGFEQVVGLDYSQKFIETANKIKTSGKLNYESIVEGNIKKECLGELDETVNRDRVSFVVGDACNLSTMTLGKFDVVLASNLLCRLPNPKKFLLALESLVVPGGFVILASPYSWLEEYTPQQQWIGGYEKDGKIVESFDVVTQLLESHFHLLERRNLPFLIREHARKYQWGLSDGSLWQRKV